ncbi:peroxiredoxin family protein [Pedobacter sp. KBW06]|uniref:peroxiredoxin family protein n=1 Tax=Pedobacter sp. KBW06 TaxID=2153359 RepID=UPI0013151129|nr:redoxin domain-containing protein [Pedobacter sp. KBW06]
MKKNILYFAIFLLLGTSVFMLTKIVKKQQYLTNIIATKQTLPNFTFYNLDSIATTNNFIPKDKPICIFYFNADCEHCQYGAKEINKNIVLFKRTQIVMVSFNSIQEIKQFKKEYNLIYPNITFLQDPKHEFKQWFGKTNVPAVFIYNSKHDLVKEYHGETKIEAITKHL